MVLNYYAPFGKHSGDLHVDADKYCLRNIATHEWGHFVNLRDLSPAHDCDSHYSRYTMWWSTVLGESKKETLECEDLHGLYHVYHEYEWDDN